jgi:hypothetical protein
LYIGSTKWVDLVCGRNSVSMFVRGGALVTCIAWIGLMMNSCLLLVQHGYTPLHVAATSGNLMAVRILVQHGGNPNAVTTVSAGARSQLQAAYHTILGWKVQFGRITHCLCELMFLLEIV